MCGPIGRCQDVSRRNSSFTTKYGYPVQLRYMGEPLCYAVAKRRTEYLHHVWVYASAADREASDTKMAADPDWKVFLAENAKAGTSSSRRTA